MLGFSDRRVLPKQVIDWMTAATSHCTHAPYFWACRCHCFQFSESGGGFICVLWSHCIIYKQTEKVSNKLRNAREHLAAEDQTPLLKRVVTKITYSIIINMRVGLLPYPTMFSLVMCDTAGFLSAQVPGKIKAGIGKDGNKTIQIVFTKKNV